MSITLIPIFILPIGVLIIAASIDTKGVGLFFQNRVGQYGKVFTIIKIRTFNETGEVSKYSAIIRKYKLDEFPQLFNILVGQMSFVGPRPDVKGYADKLKGDHRKILKLRPGITGPASIKFINEELLLSKQENPKYYNDNVIYPEKVRINLDYFYNNSIWIDFKIIFATIFRISN